MPIKNNNNCTIPNPYDGIEKNLELKDRTELGPGPANSTDKVMKAMNIQPVTFFNLKFYQMLSDVQKMLQYLYQTTNPCTLVQQTTGNGGNEAMVNNLADPGDTIVVAVQGVWGMKVADMGRRYNLNVVELKIALGEVYTIEQLEEEIVKNKAVALFMTHGESTGGTLQPLEGIGEMCHKHDCLLAVDAVVSMAVAPILVDEWKIDAVNGGSQKGLGCPAGMALLTFSPRAHERMLAKKCKPPYIYDILTLADMWGCFGKPRRYLYTYAMHMLNAVRQALLDICEEGLENVWQRHRMASERFLSKIEKLGMTHFIKQVENRFYGVNMVVAPEGVNIYQLVDYMIDNYNMETSMGAGPTSGGRILRVGFLANCARSEVVDTFVEALEKGIEYCLKHPEAAATCKVKQCSNKFYFG